MMFSDVAEHAEQIRSQSLVLRREIKRRAVHGGGGGSLGEALKVLSAIFLCTYSAGRGDLFAGKSQRFTFTFVYWNRSK
jgi:hypothetical protein